MVDQSGHWHYCESADLKHPSHPIRLQLAGDYPNNWYIFDANGVTASVTVPQPFCHSLVTASPNVVHYKEYGKNTDLETYYLPLWTQQELEACRALSHPTMGNEYLLRLYRHWGGIASIIPSASLQGIESSLLRFESAIHDIRNFGELKARLGAVKDPTFVHRVIHLKPDPSYLQHHRIFASEELSRRILLQMTIAKESDCILFVQQSTSGVEAALRGQVFEGFAHRRLQHGGQFQPRCLEGNVGVVPPVPFHRVKTPHRFEQFVASQFPAVLAPPSYCIPGPTFPSIDAVVLPNILLQMPVSQAHPVYLHNIRNYAKVLRQRQPGIDTGIIKLIFVVPPDQYDTFPKQKYLRKDKQPTQEQSPQGIQQFVIKIDTTS